MTDSHTQFAKEIVRQLTQSNPLIVADKKSAQKALIQKTESEFASFDFTPIAATAAENTANLFFSGVSSLDELQQAYRDARNSTVFEYDLAEAMAHVHPYALAFLDRLFDQAHSRYNDEDAKLIAKWVSDLDTYTAVKAVESLLNSHADLQLISIAETNNWQVHFDHLAIRCGSQKTKDAERIVDMLKSEHGYFSPQINSEAFYQFKDGWNAYVLCKILKNGQCLRLFIDQSDADDRQQIIQYWNRVYGYTAHHLAIRATSLKNGTRTAIPLSEITHKLTKTGVESLTPTGLYSCGLLEQVFTRPETNSGIPTALKNEINRHRPGLDKIIENGKLLEIVCRREMDETLKALWFNLYAIKYDPQKPLHSAPLYTYFLPAQAAHVIRTSVQVQ